METFKLKLHSSVDLITNSSTVIFTTSEGSLPAVKELVNEMLKTFNSIYTFDDIFYAEVFLDDDDVYMDHEGFPELDGVDSEKILKDAKLETMKTGVRPEWMSTCEDDCENDDYGRATTLEMVAKDAKYEELAKKIVKFLYSTRHEEGGY